MIITKLRRFARHHSKNYVILSQHPVVEDGRLLTSQGPATAMGFALHLVGLLVDEATERRIAEGLLAASQESALQRH